MSNIQPQVLPLISSASMSNATSWLLTSSGLFVDTQTITIAGVVFTTVTNLSVGPAVAGEVVLGANAAATLTNLTNAINAPTVTSLTFTALSDADARTITTVKGLTATTTATVMTLVSSNKSTVVVSETETNAAWTSVYTSSAIDSGAAGKVSMQYTAASITSGNGVFTHEVSNDGTNWVAYSKITTNVTNTNSQTDTRVASVTLNSNTSSVVSIPESFAFHRAKIVMTTDGLYSVSAFAV